MYDASHRLFSTKKDQKGSSGGSLTIEVVVGWFGSHVEDCDESEDDKGQ